LILSQKKLLNLCALYHQIQMILKAQYIIWHHNIIMEL
jgi:hypothetical protein